MKVLYIILVISTGLLLAVAVACWWRFRRHMRPSSDHALREALEDLGHERKLTRD